MSGIKSNKKTHLKHWFENTADKFPKKLALHFGSVKLSYHDLEIRANQMANFFIEKGMNHTSYVAVLLDRSVQSFVTFIAILKTGAVYVPIDVDYPDERIHFILTDLPFSHVVTESPQAKRDLTFPKTLFLDQVQLEISTHSTLRPEVDCPDGTKICYIIYTSGSTGKPKGVKISHQSIHHYVKEARALYEMNENDRVYQGLSLAFDASMEEVWMAFSSGATLVPAPSKEIRYGDGLIDFLNTQKITVLSTVPTLLASVAGELSTLRLLIFGGETLSESLIKRFIRPGLVVMNTYGPTEATVIATAMVCRENEPVTIGTPLPGYEVHILNASLQPVPLGETGELCIGGVALSEGYVSLPKMTEQKFISVPFARSERLYRTGDLARFNEKGQLEFLGRLDSQVKLRGYRIELDEVESIIRTHFEVAQVVVTLFGEEHPMLVAYVQCHTKDQEALQKVQSWAREKLPLYMQPSCWISMSAFPLLPSGKINRRALPEPTSHTITQAFVPPETLLENKLSEMWAQILGVASVSVEADFFYDLGGHSLLAAKIVSHLRRLPNFQTVSIVDLYQNPTIRMLGRKFENSTGQKHSKIKEEKKETSFLSYYTCAIGQAIGCLFQYALEAWQILLLVLLYTVLYGHTHTLGFNLCITALIFAGFPIISISAVVLLKWLLLGKIKCGKYPLWGWFYFRFWLVMRLQKNFCLSRFFLGTPMMGLYCRLLGAKVGSHCFIGSASFGVYDVITIGSHSTIAYDARLMGYTIENGWLHIGSITIGEDAYVGARSVVAPNTVIEAGGKLGDMSLLGMHQVIPSGAYYSGAPMRLETLPERMQYFHTFSTRSSVSLLRRALFGALHYVMTMAGMMVYYLCYLPAFMLVMYSGEHAPYLVTLLGAIPLGALLFLICYGVSIKLLKQLIQNKEKTGVASLYSLYYLRAWMVMKLLDTDEVYVMADTLYYPWFMRYLGAKLGKRVEMGELPHVIPDLVQIDDEGFSASSVAIAWPNIYHGMVMYQSSLIERRGFIGNMSFLPQGETIGKGSLLGCLSITPHHECAESAGTSWLGSPPLFLPKREMTCCFSEKERFTPPKKLVLMRLTIEFFRILAPTLLTLTGLFHVLYFLNILLSTVSLKGVFILFPLVEMGVSLALVGFLIGLKWYLVGRIKPDSKPIWNSFIWKNDVVEYLYSYFICPRLTNVILGTPFISVLFRLFGAKIGRKVLIDSTDFTEFDLITIEDDAAINADAVIQTHLYEDRIFKMSNLRIGHGACVGTGSVVLYDTVIEPKAMLGQFSLLMKGEVLPCGTRWEGIPAQPQGAYAVLPAACFKEASSDSSDIVLESI